MGKKPNEFPVRASIDGSEELYTQTAGNNEKFTVSQLATYINNLASSGALKKSVLANEGLLPVTGDSNTLYIIEDYNSSGTSQMLYWDTASTSYKDADDAGSQYEILANMAALPATGVEGVFYVVKNNGDNASSTFIWDTAAGDYQDIDDGKLSGQFFPTVNPAALPTSGVPAGSIALINDIDDGSSRRGLSFWMGTIEQTGVGWWSTPYFIENTASNYSGLSSVSLNSSTREVTIDDGVNAAFTFTIPDDVDDADADSSNELQTFSLNTANGEWSLSDGGGSGDLDSGIDFTPSTKILSLFGTSIDLTDLDNQALSIAGNVITLTSADGDDTIDLTDYINTVHDVADIAARDALSGIPTGSIAVIADADGNDNEGVSFYNGTIWTTPIISAEDSGDFTTVNSEPGQTEWGMTYKGSGNPTYAFASDKGTITIPSGVDLRWFKINHETAQFSGSDYDLEIIFTGQTVNAGTSSTLKIPVLNFWKRDNLSNDPPTSSNPFLNTADTPPTSQMQIIGYGANKITIRFKNIGNYGKWTIIGSL